MGRYSRQRTRTQLHLDIIDDLVELFRIDIALNRGAHQADQQLVAIEPLLRPVGFDNLDGIFAALERRKTIIARTAFATTLDSVVRLLHTGIDNAGMCLAAFGTAHGTSS